MPKQNRAGAAHRNHNIDLDAVGGIDALLEFHRRTFGDARMESDGDDATDGDDNTDGGDDDRFSGLLGDDGDSQDDTSDDSDTDEGDEGDSSDTAGGALTAEAVAQIVESAIDRRLNTPKMRNGNKGGNASRGGRDTSGAGVDPYDVREARSIYRENIADDVRFLGSAERDHAMAIANEQIAAALNRGDDPIAAGRAAAVSAAKSVRSLRKLYEAKTVKALRAKGLLVETSASGVQGRPVATGGTAAGSSGSGWARGQSAAAALGRSRSASSK